MFRLAVRAVGAAGAIGGESRSATARQLTCLFSPVDPFVLGDGVLDGKHIHRNARNELVRSKSEVIVADALAEVITLKGDSYRLKDRDLGRTPTAATSTEE